MSGDKPSESALPARNFTISAGELARAAIAGPPAWSVRLRRIEQLEAELLAVLGARLRAGAPPLPLPPALEHKRVELERLVEAHNAYYPIEANLPSSPRTLAVMDGGAPWQPRPIPSPEALLEDARAISRAQPRSRR
jgi:hypothetical protein